MLTEHWPIKGSPMKREDMKTGLVTVVLHGLCCSQIFTREHDSSVLYEKCVTVKYGPNLIMAAEVCYIICHF